MHKVLPEPVHPESHHVQTADPRPVVPFTARTLPINVDALVAQIQREFPNAHIRITGRGRSVERQAQLMADRRRANRQ
jgi:hypothetical protein